MASRIANGRWVSAGALVLLLGALAAKPMAKILWRSDATSAAPAPSPANADASPRIRFEEGHLQQLRQGDGSAHTIRSLLRVPGRMQFGDFAWNDRDVPAGRIWLRVDLSRQILSVFRGEHEIGTSVILYGQDATPTPTGDFPVRGMEKNHRSNSYDAQMPFTLWLTGDGVAIHGSDVREGLATHGCIGVPLGFAQRLFGVVKRGDLVSVLS